MPIRFFVSLPAPSLSLLPPTTASITTTTAAAAAISLSPPPPPPNRGRSATVRSSMERRRSTVSLFPPLPHRDVMLDVISAVDSHLGPHLLPSSVPSDVLSFRNPAGSSLGSLDIRRGSPSSSVDFMLESWLHCKLPSGGALDITSLLAFLDDSTDAPHLIMELIQNSPTALVLILDLLPRKDLPLHQHYIDDFYHRTQLDEQRRRLEALPQAVPYRSPSLYIRSILSPTAVAVAIDCGEGAESVMEEIVRGRLRSAAEERVRVWLDKCACSTKQMEASEAAHLRKRDGLIKTKAIEIDLSANFPRLFGPDVSNRVVAEIQKAFGQQRQPPDQEQKSTD